MNTKTTIPNDTLKAFISYKFSDDTKFQTIDSGEFSDTYLIDFNSKEFILRFNKFTNQGFVNDKKIHDQYPQLLTPKILECGDFDSFYFCISEKLPGTSLLSLPKPELEKLLESIFVEMNKFHQIKLVIDKKSKLGDWLDFLDNKTVEEYRNILPEFFEREMYRQLLNKYHKLRNSIADFNYLIHGDFGLTNIFVDKNAVSGIIDWSETRPGDFLWDLAWISFWPSEVDIIGKYKNFNKSNTNLDLTNFEVRLELYKLVIGIHSLLFAANRNDQATYLEVKTRMGTLI